MRFNQKLLWRSSKLLFELHKNAVRKHSLQLENVNSSRVFGTILYQNKLFHQLSEQKSSLNETFSSSTISKNESIDPFSLVSDELKVIKEKMLNMIFSEVPKLKSAAEYFFKLGAHGKHFRPTILLLMASSLHGMENQYANDSITHAIREQQRMIAEITEMIHVASLLHDDVLDLADKRRGISSLNFVMGNKLAVLAGDFLLARSSMALASLKNTHVVELLSMVLEHLVTGEIMQMTSNSSQSSNMEYYLQKNFCKTASLIANSCKAISILGNNSSHVSELAYLYGKHLGIAFQLIDDALDFTGSFVSLGKPSLSDLKQGLATAPVLFAAEQHPAMHELITRKFNRDGDVEQALAWVRDSEGIERTKLLAKENVGLAVKAIHDLPPSYSDHANLCRRALIEISDRVLNRSK